MNTPRVAQREQSVLCGTGVSRDTPSVMMSDPCNPQSRVCWNGDKDYQRWFTVAGMGPNATFPIDLDAAPAISTVSHNVSVDGTGSGAAEVRGLMATSDLPGGRFAVLLADSRTKRQYSNVPIANNLMYGTASQMPEYPASIYVPASNSLTGNIVSLAALPQNLTLSADSRRFSGQRGAELEASRRAAFFSTRIHLYWLGPDLGPEVTLGIGASATILMTTPSSARFEAMAFLDDSDGSYNVQVFDGQSNQAFSDAPLPHTHIFITSSATVPAIFQARLSKRPWTQSFVPQSTVAFKVVNTSVAINKIRIAIMGRLIYVDGDPASATPQPQSRELALDYTPFYDPNVGTAGPCPPRSRRAQNAQRQARRAGP